MKCESCRVLRAKLDDAIDRAEKAERALEFIVSEIDRKMSVLEARVASLIGEASNRGSIH